LGGQSETYIGQSFLICLLLHAKLNKSFCVFTPMIIEEE